MTFLVRYRVHKLLFIVVKDIPEMCHCPYQLFLATLCGYTYFFTPLAICHMVVVTFPK